MSYLVQQETGVEHLPWNQNGRPATVEESCWRPPDGWCDPISSTCLLQFITNS